MKKLKKSLIIVVLLFVLTLVGCHGHYEPKVDKEKVDVDPETNIYLESYVMENSKTYTPKTYEVPTSFDTSKNIEITFWAKNDSNITQKRIYQKAIEDFQKIYPNITVTLKSYTDYAKIYQDVITNISTNTTPNVCISYPDHVATYLSGNGIVVPLDDFVKDEKYGLGGSDIKFDAIGKDDLVTKFYDEGLLQGNHYVIPFMRSSEACYVNKDYVERLGFELPEKLTWDFIWEVSEKAMKEKKDDQVLIPFIYKSTDNMMIQMLKQKGIKLSDNDSNVFLFNNTTKELLMTIYEHTKTKAFSTFKRSSYPGNFFNAGECIFAIDSTAGATWIGSNAPLIEIPEDKLVNFETVVMGVPQFDVDNPKMISQGPSVCIFNKSDKQEVLASWLFVQYLLTNEVQIAYAKTEGYVPVTKKAQESDEYKEYLNGRGTDNKEYYYVKIDASKLVLDNIDNTFVTPVFKGSASLRNAAGDLIEKVVSETYKKKTINYDVLDSYYNEIISLEKIDQIGIIYREK